MKKHFLKASLFFLLAIHSLIVIIGAAGLFLIFHPAFEIFFKYFFIIIVGSELIFLTKCPLTILENKLNKIVYGQKNEIFFINRFFDRLVGITFPDRLIQGVLLIYFLYSIFLFF